MRTDGEECAAMEARSLVHAKVLCACGTSSGPVNEWVPVSSCRCPLLGGFLKPPALPVVDDSFDKPLPLTVADDCSVRMSWEWRPWMQVLLLVAISSVKSR